MDRLGSRFRVAERGWLAHFGLGVLLIGAYFLFTDSWLSTSILYEFIGMLGIAGIFLGVIIHRPVNQLPWWLIAAGITLFVAGDSLSTVHDSFIDTPAPFPWYSDILYVAGYPLVAVGMIMLIRSYGMASDRSAMIDSLVVVVGAGSLSWVFLISPHLNDDSLTMSARIVSLAYPIADLALLALAVRFLTMGGKSRPSAMLFFTAVASMLIADTLFGADMLAGRFLTGEIADAGWLLSYVLFGAAALHPSMRMLDQSGKERGPTEISFQRLSILGVLSLAGPVWLTVRHSRGETSDVVVIAVSSALLFLLALARLGGVALRLEDALQDREAAQSKLADSEARFRAMVQHASDITVVIDASFLHTYVSPSIERVLGFKPEELYGKTAEPLSHPDDVDASREFYREFLANPGKNVVATLRKCHIDGSWRWFDVVATNLLHDPAVNGIVINARDITERRVAEEALSFERDLLHLLMDNLPDLVFFQDRDGRYIRINRADAEFLGLQDPADAIGKTDADFLPPEIARAYLDDDLVVIGNRTAIVDRTEQVVDRKGNSRWISTTKVPTVSGTGEVSGIVGIARDITERQLAELTIHRAEQRFRDLFNDAPVMYVITENRESGPIIADCNALFLETVGRERNDVIGRPMAAFLSTQSQEALAAAYSEAMLGVRTEGERQLISRDGRLVDVFMQAQPEHDQHGVITGTRATFMDITARKSLETQLTHQAFHDPLTGLPNRMLFSNRLEHALDRASRNAGDVALLFIDLDGFKVINDSLGHGVGDKLLTTVAERLSSCVRKIDTIARFGGDEFTVLLEECSLEDAIETAQRMARRMSIPLDLDGHTLIVTASIGIASKRSPLDSADELLRNADVAMYAAKQRGKSQYAIFDTGMHQRAWKRLELESELRLAIERGEFHVYYQPILDLKSGRTREFEALVRWEHPMLGIVSPAEFIPVAEETGLIFPIGWWVIAEACRQTRAWQLAFPEIAPLSVSVNLSPRMFHQADLTDVIAGILAETGLEPGFLNVEITEGVMMQDGNGGVETLQKLKAMGVRLAVDDFGTGYSSLAYLQRLPIDVLKIDRSFIARMDEDTESLEIVRLVVGLARTLGLDVVGEGIETTEQLETLRELGCDLGQGYLLARPLQVNVATGWLATMLADDQQQIIEIDVNSMPAPAL